MAVAPKLGMEISPIGLKDPAEIERGIDAAAGTPNTGLVVTPSGLAIVHRVNLSTAKALDLEAPQSIMLRADEVIR